MATPARGIDIDQIGSPGSLINLDMEEQEMAADKKQFATIKGEIKTNKGGQKSVVFREGQHYISRMPEQSVEMVKHAMLEEHSTASRGVDSKKVLEFITSTIEFLEHGSPTVKDMRSGNPKAVQLLFHMEEMIKGSTKIKKTWAAENKPPGWPVDVPFEDPNNGSQTKKERATKDGQKNDKLRKDGLKKMYDFLRREFLRRRDEILQRKAEYLGNLPTSLQSNSTNSRWAERLILLHHRTHGVLQEAVSEASIVQNLSNLMDGMYTRTEEGERMRILFAELCSAIQTCIDVALLKDKLNSNAIITSLGEIYERYMVVTMDNCVQQVSTDTPECYTGLNCFQVEVEGTPVLPSPGGNDWNHALAQAVHQQQQHQQPMMYQQLHQQPQQPQFHHQPQSVTIVTKQENSLHQELKMLKMMDSQPSTTMETMYNTNTYRKTPPTYEPDMDYMKNVLPNDSVVLGKRKLDEDEILSSSDKTYITLQMPATSFTTGQDQISDFQTLLEQIEADDGGKVSLAQVTSAERQEVHNQLFAQETTAGNESIGVNYWSTAPEGMDVDQ